MSDERPAPASFLSAIIAHRKGDTTAIARFLERVRREQEEQDRRQRIRSAMLDRELRKRGL